MWKVFFVFVAIIFIIWWTIIAANISRLVTFTCLYSMASLQCLYIRVCLFFYLISVKILLCFGTCDGIWNKEMNEWMIDWMN